MSLVIMNKAQLRPDVQMAETRDNGFLELSLREGSRFLVRCLYEMKSSKLINHLGQRTTKLDRYWVLFVDSSSGSAKPSTNALAKGGHFRSEYTSSS